MIPWIVEKRLSDGNGIIIDVSHWTYNATTNDKPHGGLTLVENNVCVNNGGSGIHAFDAAHVDIINNTAYNNAQVMTTYADIFAGSCEDVKIMNNIIYSRVGGICNSNDKNTNVTYDYNIYFAGKVTIKGPNDKIIDPQIINLSINNSVANFSLKVGSPAIDAGTSTIFSLKDINGVSRPKGGGVDCGAYEVR